MIVDTLSCLVGKKYQSKFSTDYLFPKYQKQVERLVKFYCQQGLYGWEVTDAEISLINGKCDNVGSDPADFNIAVPIALMRAFKDAEMKILEPNMYYTINSIKDNYKSILSLVSNYGVLYDSISILTKEEVDNLIRGILYVSCKEYGCKR